MSRWKAALQSGEQAEDTGIAAIARLDAHPAALTAWARSQHRLRKWGRSSGGCLQDPSIDLFS